jgi:hypothetical protein
MRNAGRLSHHVAGEPFAAAETVMIRRRIEITHERRTRLSFPAPPWCTNCNQAAELIPASQAAAEARIPADVLDRAIASGRLPAWTGSGCSWVCLQCARQLRKE